MSGPAFVRWSRQALVALALTTTVVGAGTWSLAAIPAGSAHPRSSARPAPASDLSGSASRPVVHSAGTQGTVFIEGDSITSRYDNVAGSANQGFWSILAARLGERPVVDAQGGSGYLRAGSRARRPSPGQGCDGTTFAQRLTSRVATQATRADVVVIEGGRNDFRACTPSGGAAPASRADIRAAVDDYLDRVASLRADQDPATVFVLTPWGAHVDAVHRRLVIPVVRRQARLHGFTWVDLGDVLDPHRRGENTVDGIHPDRRGSEDLAVAILRRSDIAAQVRASGR